MHVKDVCKKHVKFMFVKCARIHKRYIKFASDILFTGI